MCIYICISLSLCVCVIGRLWKIDGYASMGSTYQPFQYPMCGVYRQISICGHEDACRARIASNSYSFVMLQMLSANAAWNLIVSVDGASAPSLLEGIMQTNWVRPGTFHHFSRGSFAFPSNYWVGTCSLSSECCPRVFPTILQISDSENFSLAHCLELATELIC